MDTAPPRPFISTAGTEELVAAAAALVEVASGVVVASALVLAASPKLPSRPTPDCALATIDVEACAAVDDEVLLSGPRVSVTVAPLAATLVVVAVPEEAWTSEALEAWTPAEVLEALVDWAVLNLVAVELVPLPA